MTFTIPEISAKISCGSHQTDRSALHSAADSARNSPTLFRVSGRCRGSFFLLYFLIFLLFTLLLAFESEARAEVSAEHLSTSVRLGPTRLGLWVDAEGKIQPFRSLAEFEVFKGFLKSHRFTDLYLQVYRGGRTWFPSMVADDTPFREALQQGFDPLGETIRLAHARGVRVHAWMNTLRIEREEGIPLLQILGRSIVLRDNHGESLLDYTDKTRPTGDIGRYFQIDTPGLWLDPSSERLQHYLTEVVRDLLVAYPALDGVHLDMIRYPYGLPITPASSIGGGLDFGHTEEARRQFLRDQASVAVPDLSGGLAGDKADKKVALKGDDWDAWRRSQVTAVVEQMRELMDDLAPDKELSAAVLAWPDRAYQSSFQDWRDWLERGIIDTAVPMAYTKDAHLASYLSKQSVAFRSERKVYMGLGAWLFLDNPTAFSAQVSSALKHQADGVVLFSYANLASPRGEKLMLEVEKTLSALRAGPAEHIR